MKWKKVLISALMLSVIMTGCGGAKGSQEASKTESGAAAEDESSTKDSDTAKQEPEEKQTRTVKDSAGREVEIPAEVESIVCLNVSTLRYTCYMQAQDLVIGVEDYEQEKSISRPYNYVNYDLFTDIPVIGNNGEHYLESIIETDPDVIMMSAYDDADVDGIQSKTGIPVVLVPGSDEMMDEGAYETFRIMGEVYGKEERAEELTKYMDTVKKDLESRTKDVKEEDKPSVYVGGVSYKGAHGFEGTEAGYGPFKAINAKNMADETGQKGPFNVDLEQVLAWNPDVLFVDFNGLDLIKEHYSSNPEYYSQLKAVEEGKVYSQISFRSSASNLETALADTYYAASVLYPEQFSDIDPAKKADEIFNTLLGTDFYETLKENGYEFRQIQIGQE